MNTPQIINNIVPSVLVSDHQVKFELQTPLQQLLNLLEVLKLHSLTQMKNLVEMTAVDSPAHEFRFYVTYFLLSTQTNMRVRVSVQTNEILPIISATALFNSAN